MKYSLRLFLTGLSIVFFLNGKSATILTPGDIAIISVSSVAPKSFRFINLVPIQAGTKVLFTDDAWVDSVKSFRGSEGVLTYTFADNVPAGNVVEWVKDANGFVSSGTFTLSTSGDNILCYQNDISASFIYGVGWAKSTKSNWSLMTSSSGLTTTSDIPAPLSVSNKTISYLGSADSYAFSDAAVRNGSKEELLSAFLSPLNYTSSNEEALAVSNTKFTVSSSTSGVPEPGTTEDPETPRIIDKLTAKRIGSCALPMSDYADSTLYSSAAMSQKFDASSWNGDDTLIFVADTLAFVLVKDTMLLKTNFVEDRIEICEGSVAQWYVNGTESIKSESIEINCAGQYWACFVSETGCTMRSEPFTAFETVGKLEHSNSSQDMIYVDMLGRVYLYKPSVPHVCLPMRK